MLKTAPKNESERIKNKNWSVILTKTALQYKDLKKFWDQLKRLKGSKTPQNQFIKINNKNLMEYEEKEQAHKEIWSEIFQIIPEENMNYDMEKEREVATYWALNNDKRTSYEYSDIRRLQVLSDIDTLI